MTNPTDDAKGPRDVADRPLPAQAGGVWLPSWTARPGAFPVLGPVVHAVPLWIAIYSVSGDFQRPCFANRATLAATIGASEATVKRHLAALREAVAVQTGATNRTIKVPLVLEIDQGRDRDTRQSLPPLRWALDPLNVDHWRPRIKKQLGRLRCELGKDGRWLSDAIRSLDAAERRIRILEREMRAVYPVRVSVTDPSKTVSIGSKPRKRYRGRKMTRHPEDKMTRKGMGGTRGEGGEVKVIPLRRAVNE